MMPSLTQSNALLLVGRILLGAGFAFDGFGMLMNPAGAPGYIQSVGLPGVLVYGAIVALLGGGLLIIVGFQTRLVALFMALFTLFLAVMFHHNLSAMNELIIFKKDIGIAAGFLIMMVAGAGEWSVDGARGVE